MIATAACNRFRSLAGGTARSATVHSVFAHAVNLELEGRKGLVGLIAEQKALTPYAVSVRIQESFFETGIRAGMAAAIEPGRILVPQAGFAGNERLGRCLDGSRRGAVGRHQPGKAGRAQLRAPTQREPAETLLLRQCEALVSDCFHLPVRLAGGALCWTPSGTARCSQE